MLLGLDIKNIALIEKLNIEVKEGMTVLTGETGAGKSIIIDAVNLLLGARGGKNLVRHGEEKATVQGLFSANDEVNSILDDNGVDTADEVVLSRVLSADGKSYSFSPDRALGILDADLKDAEILVNGKLTATALVSQQNSESKTVNTKGGVQTTDFSINCDEYDQNRHFFLSHFFRDNYDQFASKLPYVSSGVNITRIEVWVTNKSGNYNQSRNIVAFMDLAENKVLANNYWSPNMALDNPANSSNNLLSVIKEQYPDARNINTVTQALEPLSAYGIEGGKDYEKVESARLLSSSEYTLNSSLGYISIKSALNADEVLGVAFEYTYKGQVYQVGEFSGDITTTGNSLYVKMLKSTTVAPRLPMWDLMMKNVYSLGAYQIQKSKFKLTFLSYMFPHLFHML